MTEWYRSAFGQEYLALYGHRNDAEAEQLTELVLKTTGLKAGARVLDAPCGAGRHLRAFTGAGMKAYGFDLSPDLLNAAVAAGTRPSTFVRGDLRHIPFKSGSFELVVNLFSSLGYFPDDETNLLVVCRLVELCKIGGWAVIDFMNSDYLHANLVPASSRVTPEGIRVDDRRWIEGEAPRVNKETTLHFPDGRTRQLRESVRLFQAEELRRKLVECGLEVEAEFGDYQGSPFTPESKRIILMGRRVR